MNEIKRDIVNKDGTMETIVITANDNYKIKLNGTYKLANNSKKENKIVNNFRKSIIGSEIGIKSAGFSTMAILSTIIAIGALCAMYITLRV